MIFYFLQSFFSLLFSLRSFCCPIFKLTDSSLSRIQYSGTRKKPSPFLLQCFQLVPFPFFLRISISAYTPHPFCILSTSSLIVLILLILNSKSVAVQWLRLVRPFATPGTYTVRGILQARILEWVAFPFSRGSSQPTDRAQVHRIADRFFTSSDTREAQEYWSG